MSRIGIFSGSFDPVHEGHIAFALQSLTTANLDVVYFAPESKPRRKDGVTHIGHRTAMLELAAKSHTKLRVLEMPDKQFSTAKTLPRLTQKFPNDELFYLCGSDMLRHMHEWVLVDVLLRKMGLIVGLRQESTDAEVKKMIAMLPVMPGENYIIKGQHSDVSAGAIREAVASNQPAHGLLASTAEYINLNWLYVTPGHHV